jgi:hypothetical protein
MTAQYANGIMREALALSEQEMKQEVIAPVAAEVGENNE